MSSLKTIERQPLEDLLGMSGGYVLDFTDATYELAPLPDEDLVRFYGSAQAVLVPSRYEGFGFPALEAMACGAPVAVANAGALPDVVGEAGLLVAPDDPKAWLQTCQQLFRDEALRRDLSARGRERAGRYAWPDCAQRTLQVYRRALGS